MKPRMRPTLVQNFTGDQESCIFQSRDRDETKTLTNQWWLGGSVGGWWVVRAAREMKNKA